MAAKVSLEDIARRAGVHRSTVSLALRDHPRISKETRERVQRLASDLGYRINPLVAALMQSRRSGRSTKDVVLAYITNYPTRFGWRPPHHDRPDYFPGAAARAEELGYKLEHFWLGEPGMTPERMSDILTARGINGVLIGRLPPGKQEIRLRWESFSSIALGMTLRNPNLHRVSEDFFSGGCQAAEQVFKRGYRRIGFVFSDVDDCPRVGDQWLGACLRQQMRHFPGDLIPHFDYREGADHQVAFEAWFKEYRPDVLMVTHTRPVLVWLERMGLSVPRDVGLASLNNDHLENGWSGIHCSPQKLGALATDMLVGFLHRGDSGVPDDPHEVLLGGEWQEGATLRPLSSIPGSTRTK